MAASSRRADKSWSRLDAVSEKEGQGGLGVEPPGADVPILVMKDAGDQFNQG